MKKMQENFLELTELSFQTGSRMFLQRTWNFKVKTQVTHEVLRTFFIQAPSSGSQGVQQSNAERCERERETGEQDPNAPPWSDSEGTPGRRGGRLGPPTSPHQGGAEALPKTPPVPEACERFGRKVTTKSLRRNQKTKQMKRKKAIGQLQKTNELGERVRNLKHRLPRMDQNGSIEQRHTTRSEMQATSSKKTHLEEPEAMYLGKGKEIRRGGVRLI